MFDKLESLVERLDTVLQQLNDPDVAGDQNRFRDLMKEQSDLAPIVEKYKEYVQEKQNIEESLELLEEESDEEMKELAKEELSESKANVERLEEELKILLIPKESAPEPAETKLLCLRQTWPACTGVMRKDAAGRWRH